MLERYHNIGGHLRLDPEGTLTSYADAQATIADLQGQVEAARKKVEEMNAWVSAMSTANIATMTHTSEMQERALEAEQRAAQLEGENKALVDAHRDFKVHLSHCNFGEHAQVCKYGREETCSALMPSWVWFGNALQRSEALQADHASCARVLGLERFTERERVRYRLALVSIATSTCCGPCEEAKKVARAALDEDIQTMEQYRAASLPAQRAKLAQGGAVSKPVVTCNRHSDCAAADEKARAKGALSADHCHDDCCSECFGN